MLIFYLSFFETETDKASFIEFYDKHKLKCLHIACKVTGGKQVMAEDALHNAFIVIIKDWKNFSDLPCCKQVSRFVLIVKNKAIDLLREAKRKEYSELDDELFDGMGEGAEATALSEEGYKALLRCVSKLPEIYKTVFELKFEQDLSNNEISRLMNLTPSAVSMRLHRARLMLQKILSKEGIGNG